MSSLIPRAKLAALALPVALVAALSADWGSFRTPAGKAMYFTLAFQPDLPPEGDRAGAGQYVGTVSREPV